MAGETKATKGDTFSCPECGQRHRADLAALRDRKTSAMRTLCAGCRRALVVEWRDGAAFVRAETHGDTTEDLGQRPPPGATPIPTMARAEAAPATVRPSGSTRLARAKARSAEEDDGEPPAPEVPAEFPPGTQLGRYRLEEAIGHGGTGSVYRAFDPTTNRYVALKILAKELKDERRDRFLREIEVQANLRHPHIMPVFDRGEHEGRPYFTMELLYRPFTLTDVVTLAREGTLFRYTTLAPLADLRQLVRTALLPVCDGIYVANVENGVIHRDLKPDNVLIDSRTLRAYVIDFGICHRMDRPGIRISSTVVAPTVEQTGIVGTPRFLPPEQAKGSVHERTDVWGLGSILRYLISGEPPIAPASAITRAELKRRVDALRQAEEAARAAGDEAKATLCAEKLARLQAEDVRPLDALYEDARSGRYVPLPEGTSPELVAIVDRAMAPRPLDRYPHASALGDDLQAWLLGAKKPEGVGGLGAHERRRAAVRTVGVVVTALAAGAIGFGLGWVLAPKGRDAIVAASAGGLATEADGLSATVRALGAPAARARRDAVEDALAHDALAARLADLQKRVDALPSDAGRDVRDRVRALSERLAPARLRWTGPPEAVATLYDLSRANAQRQVGAGEVELAPGEYRLALGSAVRVPVRVPFAPAERGGPAPLAPVAFPLDPAHVPEGYVFVAGGTVTPRGAPASAATEPVAVAAFLMERAEVDAARYSEFLEAIADPEERARRVPAQGFQPDPLEKGHFRPAPEAGALPVTGVSADDALAYCAWRSGREGANVRLPSEAEWVLAAGGGIGMTLPSGSEGDLAEEKTRAALTPPMRPARPPAGEEPDVSPYGVERMLGNAAELVTEPSGGFLRKGGAVGDAPLAAAIRAVRPVARDARDARVGFRVVRELAPAK
jgi:serine/threonine protein kinase/formylglycine-generating enzyme required for sulfatase activity